MQLGSTPARASHPLLSARPLHLMTDAPTERARRQDRDQSMTSPSSSLLHRRLDLLYFVYFALHILIFIFVDGQNFYPTRFVPLWMSAIVDDYLAQSADPFVLAMRSDDRRFVWFATSMWSSLVFQNPVFVAGVWCLWRDDKRIYPVMASYALLAAVTTMQCLASVVWGSDGDNLTPANLKFLLQSYVPFVVIPVLMLVDMSLRSIRLIQLAQQQCARIGSDHLPSRKKQ